MPEYLSPINADRRSTPLIPPGGFGNACRAWRRRFDEIVRNLCSGRTLCHDAASEPNHWLDARGCGETEEEAQRITYEPNDHDDERDEDDLTDNETDEGGAPNWAARMSFDLSSLYA
jgi:hypothetical protein